MRIRNSLRVSGQSSDRTCSQSRHPHRHCAAGAHRPAYGGRDFARYLRRQDRRILHATRSGTENAYGGVAQAYSESIPILVVPGGYPRRTAQVGANYYAAREMRGISKMAESITSPDEVVNVMRRAMSRIRNGRGGPSIVEVPADLVECGADHGTQIHAGGEDPHGAGPGFGQGSRQAARQGQAPGVARRARRALGQSLEAGSVNWRCIWQSPVVTSLEGKSAFDETHELSLGSGGVAVPKPVRHFLDNADVIFGIGCSFTETAFGVPMPKGKTMIHRHARRGAPQQGHLRRCRACWRQRADARSRSSKT